VPIIAPPSKLPIPSDSSRIMARRLVERGLPIRVPQLPSIVAITKNAILRTIITFHLRIYLGKIILLKA